MPFQHLLLNNLNLDPDILVNSNIRHNPGQREKKGRLGTWEGKQDADSIHRFKKQQEKESPLSIGAAGQVTQEEVEGLGGLNRWVAVRGGFWKR